MRIASWNVNSIRTRVSRVVDWMERADVDVLCMQEIKCKPEQFPYQQFEEAGYEVQAHGLNQWNGVAIASRLPMTDVRLQLPEQPGYANTGDPVVEARAMSADVEGVRLWSLYVPNGRDLGHPHLQYKLDWLRVLRQEAERTSGDLVAYLGDFNIAPLDGDVWDMAAFEGSTHVSQPERDAFNALLGAGLQDVVRDYAEGYTYWDYKAGRWPKNEGMRIDFVLTTGSLADLVTDASIHRDERAGDAPSDHVPVVVDLDLETELDDDRPMIF
ncbi:MAG TPA: exodeoxyribonuclease III [Candidatus Agrococcus pullicola]|uniref:Exodeoxyribonuclease III n=1 Tax=Candidatus Agrococcus pullicola TaxID=2838429 RepID=A0A9D2CAT9_9MICO|nr:exodeoxyribonuclease III [Candidatus Agrococcus pullicola]